MIIRHLIGSCCLFLAAGCIPAPPTPEAPVASAEQQLILQVLDEFTTGPSTAKLLELERLYPQHPMTSRLRALADALGQSKQQIASLQQDKTRCLKDQNRLAKEFRELQEDQEKLRKLVIEMEKRRR
jgi:hypothetical protein